MKRLWRVLVWGGVIFSLEWQVVCKNSADWCQLQHFTGLSAQSARWKLPEGDDLNIWMGDLTALRLSISQWSFLLYTVQQMQCSSYSMLIHRRTQSIEVCIHFFLNNYDIIMIFPIFCKFQKKNNMELSIQWDQLQIHVFQESVRRQKLMSKCWTLLGTCRHLGDVS